MRGRIIPGRTVGERPQLPRTGSSAGAWCETWLCSGGQSAAVNSAQGCPVNDLQSAARSGGTAPSCALLVAGAVSDEPWEVRMIGIARGEIKQSSHGQGAPPNRRPEGREAFWVCAPATEQMERISRASSSPCPAARPRQQAICEAMNGRRRLGRYPPRGLSGKNPGKKHDDVGSGTRRKDRQ